MLEETSNWIVGSVYDYTKTHKSLCMYVYTSVQYYSCNKAQLNSKYINEKIIILRPNNTRVGNTKNVTTKTIVSV